MHPIPFPCISLIGIMMEELKLLPLKEKEKSVTSEQ